MMRPGSSMARRKCPCSVSAVRIARMRCVAFGTNTLPSGRSCAKSRLANRGASGWRAMVFAFMGQGFVGHGFKAMAFAPKTVTAARNNTNVAMVLPTPKECHRCHADHKSRRHANDQECLTAPSLVPGRRVTSRCRLGTRFRNLKGERQHFDALFRHHRKDQIVAAGL